MDITLIIPAHNEEKWIAACLSSITANPRNKFKEIIVIDNASSDKTAEVAKQFPGVRVVREDKKGTRHARQRGFIESTSELIAFTDADCVVPEEWFETAERLVQEHPHAVFWAGSIRYFDGHWFKRAVMRMSWWIVPVAYTVVGYVGVTGNCAVRRSALEKAGGLDHTIPFYGDDTDLARRLHKVGTCVFRMELYIYSSMRRFSGNGFIRTLIEYSLNYIWLVLFKRPFSKEYRDVR